MKPGAVKEGMRLASAAAGAIGIHLVFGFVMVFGLSLSDAREVRRPPVINATIVDLSTLQQSAPNQDRAREQRVREEGRQRERKATADRRAREAAQKKNQQQAADQKRERERLAALDKQRLEQQQRRSEDRKQADELRRKREAIAKQREQLEADTQAAAAKARAEEEEDLMRQLLAQEESGRQAEQAAVAEATKRQEWEGRVRQLVQQSWRKPPTTRDDMTCIVNIRLVPGGDVTDVSLANCRTDSSTERSIKDAVMRSSPLPWEGFEDVAPRAFGFRFCAQEDACTSN